ncbi:MAG TPA: hypothetical protein VNG71_14945 [Pyrinomonadaceae bacterium]|nr:hypothetical protein [Pyrinomonadaceae bacterium]
MVEAGVATTTAIDREATTRVAAVIPRAAPVTGAIVIVLRAIAREAERVTIERTAAPTTRLEMTLRAIAEEMATAIETEIEIEIETKIVIAAEIVTETEIAIGTETPRIDFGMTSATAGGKKDGGRSVNAAGIAILRGCTSLPTMDTTITG